MFPHASFAYAEALYKGQAQEEALRKASQAWFGDNFGQAGEANEIENIICFGRNIPFDEEFVKNAAWIFNVLFEHQEKLESGEER